jgi:hypothetical protein
MGTSVLRRAPIRQWAKAVHDGNLDIVLPTTPTTSSCSTSHSR